MQLVKALLAPLDEYVAVRCSRCNLELGFVKPHIEFGMDGIRYDAAGPMVCRNCMKKEAN